MTTHVRPDGLTAAAPPPARVALARGDGIGPEIVDATLEVLEAAGARLAFEPVAVGEAAYRAGHLSGIPPEAWGAIRGTGVLLKGPITTPQGGGYKSLNVTLRKSLGLFANVRPCNAYAPFVATKHPALDLVVVRENEEDLYAGIEHRQTDEVYQCLKLVSRPGCERIARYAFAYARANGRKRVTCFTKDNIMKMTDGLFHRVFDEVGEDYPDIARDHMIVDIGAARLASTPERFDVLVMPNLYGDILSDVAAEIAGSVGLAPSANVGRGGAMFEAIHGSAPDIAGQGIANPSGLMLAGVMMLVHLGQARAAERLHNAWLSTIEDGVHTADVFEAGASKERVGTAGFARAVAERVGAEPRRLAPRRYAEGATGFAVPEAAPTIRAVKELLGVDVFVHWEGQDPDELAARLSAVRAGWLKLSMITNRGVKVWPHGLPETSLTDHWRCRFTNPPGMPLVKAIIAELQLHLAREGVDFVKTEHLCTFDGEAGYSLGQGQ